MRVNLISELAVTSDPIFLDTTLLDPTSLNANSIAYLRSPTTIRERCGKLFALAQADKLRYFRCDLTQLDAVADYVIQVMDDAYPDRQIPFHSRWRHFEVDGMERLQQFDRDLAHLSPLAKAQAQFDLVIPSVLLDAGAGDRWQYVESTTQQVWRRSEGLAIASFDLFIQGRFSSQQQQPYQADAQGLQQLTEEALAEGFQVTPDNLLVGLTGRWQLLQKLGQTLSQHPDLFGTDSPRPGNLVNYLLAQAKDGQLSANQVLQAVLVGLSDIWAGRITLAGVNLGDVWPHSALAGADSTAELVPFHKLSQWLTYSLLEPLQSLGLTITDLDAMTGLPEYRNGGLCLDLGLLRIKDESILRSPQLPSAEAIVEWRALTVCLLDQIADTIRRRLNLTATELPLVKVLQGGTWTAGRKIAAQLRPGGMPPITIASDGTVF
jgi:Protein of unknown function (DUF1688)